MAKGFTEEDDALLDQLGIEVEAEKAASFTPKQERVIAGFEEIVRFVEEHGRIPQHGEDKDIFERLYAVRLDRVRGITEFHELLKPFDTAGLLDMPAPSECDRNGAVDSDDELLAALGVETEPSSELTELKHVKARQDRQAPEEVAQRKRCEDFEEFNPLFQRVQREIDSGERKTKKYQQNAAIDVGDLFIIDGQKVLVARMGEEFSTDFDRMNRRLRVIYDNGTESNLLLRSLQRALYKDENGRRILPSDSDVPALFSGEAADDDIESGHIYVVRSLADDPFIAEHRDVVHKIGVTGGEVAKRIANAKKDPTFLLADVELVGSYRLANVNRSGLERLIHRFFAEARLEVKLQDRFGSHVKPREWFLVPLTVIQEFVDLLNEGRAERCEYDTKSAKIVERGSGAPA